ncbi:MAG: ankyrin repeat domain-containing protein [Armatimonadota bacterium]
MKRFVKPCLIIVAILAVVYLGIRYTVNSPDEGGLTPVHFAAQEGDAEKVSRMLLVGGRVDARTPDGITPLHLAMNPDVVTVLHQRGADINDRAGNGGTPLHFAALNEMPSVAQRLIKLGADVNAVDAEKETPLHMAAMGGDIRTAALLLEHGADPRLRNARGLTPRQLAQRENHPALAQALAKLERGRPARE